MRLTWLNSIARPIISARISTCNNGLIISRQIQSKARANNQNQNKVGLYMASIVVGTFAASFAAVPLYRLYCQSTGKSVQAFKTEEDKVEKLKPDKDRLITVKFETSTHGTMPWGFKPLQSEIKIHPGETALAFYRVTNPLEESVIGVATYTVMPYEAAVHLNKIQCFCFEEQLLRPKEDVFMPLLFYLDTEITKDPQLAGIDEVILSYTFFKSKGGELLELD